MRAGVNPKNCYVHYVLTCAIKCVNTESIILCPVWVSIFAIVLYNSLAISSYHLNYEEALTILSKTKSVFQRLQEGLFIPFCYVMCATLVIFLFNSEQLKLCLHILNMSHDNYHLLLYKCFGCDNEKAGIYTAA